ncbi:hypothetical protein HHK36_004281 [Tetracentron sinense]|uniref:Tetratricopeptide repeat protein n=1 Tax=Tetracentron sinense TaxID=13715 RepID=A0A835DQ27_TETSI|nr:hypothetical protein HHK36_004281 [Tetracentron sinense]
MTISNLILCSFLKDGRYREALGKWEAALTLVPERAVLHEQKAQILLEIGDAWNALKAATRAPQFLFSFSLMQQLILFFKQSMMGCPNVETFHYIAYSLVLGHSFNQFYATYFAGATELEPSWAEVAVLCISDQKFDYYFGHKRVICVAGQSCLMDFAILGLCCSNVPFVGTQCGSGLHNVRIIEDLSEASGLEPGLKAGLSFDPELEAWLTLARAQLNYGEPDAAIQSFDRALTIKPDSKEARDDRQTALHLVKRRKQLHSSGLSETENRYVVGE